MSYPPPADCSTVLLYGQKRDLNKYLAATPGAPHHTIAEIVAFSSTFIPPMKYGQAIFEAATQVDTSPGSADTLRYQSDRATDLALSRGALDAVYNGPDGIKGTDDDFDAIEVVLKVLDGRPVNGKFWVFYGALSNVEYTLTVTDTQTGVEKTYFNPLGRLASVADTGAF